MNERLTYKQAGVDIEEGYRAVSQMKKHIARTFNANVLTDVGNFGGLYQLPSDGVGQPVLVAGTDGVGTKLKIAFMADKHDTVGQDLVAMCVNDVLCQGAKPLFFLDYIATGKLNADRAAELVKGIADGCQLAGCALIGGETAEMPGFYAEGEYDLAGFTVGLVDKAAIVDGRAIQPGDKVIGLASSGFHSNGYSLIRKLIFERAELALSNVMPGTNQTVADILLTPTRIYVQPLLKLFEHVVIKGAAHITGGGFIENIPRTLPAGMSAKIARAAWSLPASFSYLQSIGKLSDKEMFNTFNMGIGFVVVVAAGDADKTVEIIAKAGCPAYCIGDIVASPTGVIL